MTVSIDWSARIVTVPEADLTLVDAGPPALYSLDTDEFRREVLGLEAAVDGMPNPTIFDHNTTYTVAGVTYARKVEMINGYRIRFEDGQYTVRLEGSNNNLFDQATLVRNQVSVVPTNAAGLIVTSTGGVTPGDAAEAVWEAYTASHGTNGTMGALLGILGKLGTNRTVTDPVAGTFTVYDDDDTTVLYSGPLWEDAAATQPYRGEGAERRDRLT